MIKVYIPGMQKRSYEYRLGDAQIIHDSSGHAIVIDGGEAGICNQLISYCKANSIGMIDILIVTHWHYDHDKGLDIFLDSPIVVKKIYCPPVEELKGLGDDTIEEDIARGNRRLAKARGMGKTIIYPAAGKKSRISVGEIVVDLWRRKAERADKDDYEVNNTSIQAYFPQLHYLTTGDIVSAFSGYLETKPGTVKVFKIPHHGNACTTRPCQLLQGLGAKLCWYNDMEPNGVPVGGTGFSKWGAGYCKEFFDTIPTSSPIVMVANNGLLKVSYGTKSWEFAVPYNTGEWEEKKGRWMYKTNGQYVKGKPYQIGGKWYYFDKDGYTITGWYKPDGHYRWLMPPKGEMYCGGWKDINGSKYYFDDYGRRYDVGPHKIGNKWYYFGDHGELLTGWVRAGDGILRYCDPYMLTGRFIDVGGNRYYLDSYGRRIEDRAYQVDGKWYYFDKNGVMRRGWYKPDAYRRYLDPETGAMYTDRTAMIDGKNWKFDGYGRAFEVKDSDPVQKVLDIAEAEVGYTEKRSNSGLDSKTANAGSANYTKYGRDMHAVYPQTMDFPAAWCDAFVDWCFYKAFGAKKAQEVLCGRFDDYTYNSIGHYKNEGRWSKTAHRGDQIFFGGSGHTGLVTKVEGGKVYTIEGNAGNAVRKKTYSESDKSILGYGRPKYEII